MLIKPINNTSVCRKIDLRDESEAKEILVGDWNCSISEKYYTGPLYWSIDEIKDNKFTGYSEQCSNRAPITGKIKKKSISFEISETAGCSSYVGKMKYNPDDI